MAVNPSGIELRPVARMTGDFWSTAIKMAELSLAQAALFSFPLVFAVVCARNLGPVNYGILALYTAITSLLCMFIEFGFDSIGVREVHSANRRDGPEQVMWNITLAKLIVCVSTAIVAVPVLLMTRSPAEASISFAMLAYMVGFALDTSWYLRSLELTRPVMLLAAVTRLAGVVLLLCVVRGHDDIAAAMWSYAFVAWANALVGWIFMHRCHVVGKPSFDLAHLKSLFASGTSIVMGNMGAAALQYGGIAMLGSLADPVLTGAANMAVRIRTAGQATLVPLVQFGFVRLSAMTGSDGSAVVAGGRRLFYLQMGISLTVALLISINADWISALAYGLPSAPEPAAVMVRILAISIPPSVAGTLLGLQCLTLFNRERAYVVVQSLSAAMFFGLLVFSNAGKSANYAWAVLAAETCTVLASGLYLRRVVRSS